MKSKRRTQDKNKNLSLQGFKNITKLRNIFKNKKADANPRTRWTAARGWQAKQLARSGPRPSTVRSEPVQRACRAVPPLANDLEIAQSVHQTMHEKIKKIR